MGCQHRYSIDNNVFLGIHEHLSMGRPSDDEPVGVIIHGASFPEHRLVHTLMPSQGLVRTLQDTLTAG